MKENLLPGRGSLHSTLSIFIHKRVLASYLPSARGFLTMQDFEGQGQSWETAQETVPQGDSCACKKRKVLRGIALRLSHCISTLLPLAYHGYHKPTLGCLPWVCDPCFCQKGGHKPTIGRPMSLQKSRGGKKQP